MTERRMGEPHGPAPGNGSGVREIAQAGRRRADDGVAGAVQPRDGGAGRPGLKVLEAIEQAGFVPNRLASSMRGAGRIIGTVVPPLINSGIAEQVQGMSDECHEQRLFDAAGAGRVHRRGRGAGDPHAARLAAGRDDPAELRPVGHRAGAAGRQRHADRRDLGDQAADADRPGGRRLELRHRATP